VAALVVALGAAFTLVLIPEAASRLSAIGLVLDGAGALLLGIPLLRTRTSAVRVASDTRYDGSNPALADDLIRSSRLGMLGLVTLIVGFGMQLWGIAAG